MELLKLMEQAARSGGDLALALLRAGGVRAEDKNEAFGVHFVTEADRAAEEKILRVLADGAPGIPVVAEERGYTDGALFPPECFLVDPIDGTTAFFNGCREWGVMISHLVEHQPVRAVVYLPALGILATGAHRIGCHLNGTPIRLEPEKPLDKILLGFEAGPWWVRDPSGAGEQVLLPLIRAFAARSLMSSAGSTVAMLRGETGAYINVRIGKPWDFAPGALLVTEASGIACAPDGSALRWDTMRTMDVVFAASRPILDPVLEITRPWYERLHAS